MLIRPCSVLNPLLPSTVGNHGSYRFLRRLVTTPHLPTHLQESFQLRDGSPTIHILVPPPLPILSDNIFDILKSCVQVEHLPAIRTVQVPVDGPSSVDQAALWSRKYWPCTFNPASQTIQKAPSLHVLQITKAELDRAAHLESYFSLAGVVAAECVDEGLGRQIAAVVVDPLKNEVIAAAGDARWTGQPGDEKYANSYQHRQVDGRPELHALMRAVAMVSEKKERIKSNQQVSTRSGDKFYNTDHRSTAQTKTERIYTTTNTENIASCEKPSVLPDAQSEDRLNAYLCNGLDVYLTHEPCVACTMAMVHSRFRACVFARRMPQTGGCCSEKADGGLGYGLFWRQELNWRVMTFHYPEGDKLHFLQDKNLVNDIPEERVHA